MSIRQSDKDVRYILQFHIETRKGELREQSFTR